MAAGAADRTQGYGEPRAHRQPTNQVTAGFLQDIQDLIPDGI